MSSGEENKAAVRAYFLHDHRSPEETRGIEAARDLGALEQNGAFPEMAQSLKSSP